MACGECLLHTASEVEVFGDEADDGTGSVDDDMNPTLWIPRPDAVATLIKGRGSLHAISRVLESIPNGRHDQSVWEFNRPRNPIPNGRHDQSV
jgi:hypothetical protein